MVILGDQDIIKVFYIPNASSDREIRLEENSRIQLQDLNNLTLKFVAYQDNSLHKIRMKFLYSFTQNEGLDE